MVYIPQVRVKRDYYFGDIESLFDFNELGQLLNAVEGSLDQQLFRFVVDVFYSKVVGDKKQLYSMITDEGELRVKRAELFGEVLEKLGDARNEVKYEDNLPVVISELHQLIDAYPEGFGLGYQLEIV